MIYLKINKFNEKIKLILYIINDFECIFFFLFFEVKII